MDCVLVAVAAPIPALFSYRVPDDLAGRIDIGHLVEIPFGRSRRRGVVVELGGAPPDGVEAKPVTRIVED